MSDNVIGISENRIRHMLQVGRTAETLASELFDWPEDKCRAMFLLGYLHDFGYEYSVKQSDHPRVGGEMLRIAGYKYWREVQWHGIPHPPYQSNELLVLNLADLLTDAKGATVSLGTRLHDIASRYGEDSKQYIEAKALSEETAEQFAAIGSRSEFLERYWRS